MRHIIHISAATATVFMASGLTASAQVSVRAPFVRVEVGGPGVYVRAPFVNLFVPSRPRTVYVVPGQDAPPPFVAPVPAPEPLQDTPKKTVPNAPTPGLEVSPDAPKKPTPAVPPAPKPKPLDPDDAPPVPATPESVLTLDQFNKSFQAKSGNYEVNLLNPITNKATTVRFSLPEGTPRRVNVSHNRIEFDYGPRRYVRIQFDQDGAEVISR